jgi:transcriptional regulator with XRE-family HTH domain
MSSFGDRIKEIRKSAGLTQQKFAERIGTKQNTVAQYEIGRNVPMDPVITAICREFNVNEVWLRTGEGDPYQEESRQEQILKFAAQTIKGSDEFRKNFVAMLAKLDVEDWEALAKIFNKLANEQK